MSQGLNSNLLLKKNQGKNEETRKIGKKQKKKSSKNIQLNARNERKKKKFNEKILWVIVQSRTTRKDSDRERISYPKKCQFKIWKGKVLPFLKHVQDQIFRQLSHSSPRIWTFLKVESKAKAAGFCLTIQQQFWQIQASYETIGNMLWFKAIFEKMLESEMEILFLRQKVIWLGYFFPNKSLKAKNPWCICSILEMA